MDYVEVHMRLCSDGNLIQTFVFFSFLTALLASMIFFTGGFFPWLLIVHVSNAISGHV
jgi:hypothetical protein